MFDFFYCQRWEYIIPADGVQHPAGHLILHLVLHLILHLVLHLILHIILHLVFHLILQYGARLRKIHGSLTPP